MERLKNSGGATSWIVNVSMNVLVSRERLKNQQQEEEGENSESPRDLVTQLPSPEKSTIDFAHHKLEMCSYRMQKQINEV